MAEFGKAGKLEEAERVLEDYIERDHHKLYVNSKAITSIFAMMDYFIAAHDEAGAAKYAEKIAAKYPEMMPILCGSGEGLKEWMVKDVKAGVTWLERK